MKLISLIFIIISGITIGNQNDLCCEEAGQMTGLFCRCRQACAGNPCNAGQGIGFGGGQYCGTAVCCCGNGCTNPEIPDNNCANPTTANPTTARPTTAQPTTANPTTAMPTTANPTTALAKEWEVHSVIDSEIGCPCGMVSMWYGPADTWPEGYVLCDGSTHMGMPVPNLLDMFIVGAGSTYAPEAMGGSVETTLTIDNLPSHAHGLNLDTQIDGGHTHDHALTADAVGDHTHSLSDATVTIKAAGSHGHGPGTLLIDDEDSHYHPINARDTANDGAHKHVMQAFLDDDESTILADQVPGIKAENILDSTKAIKDIANSIHETENDGTHVHSVPATNTNAGTAHTHGISGATASVPDHMHSIEGTTALDGGHSHSVSGTIDAGSHVHPIDGNTEPTGKDMPFEHLPPYKALYFICCIGRDWDD